MSQNNLHRALELLETLRPHIDPQGQTTFQEVTAALQQAQRLGEGQDSEALQSRIQDVIQENAQFISVMVHEIRKPMTSIRGYSDMLAKNIVGPLNDMQSQFANTIRNNVISMEHLITDINDLSKMRSGRMGVSPKMDMIKNIVMQLEKDQVPEAEARRVKLTFDIPSGLPMLNLDSARVEQALRKLIDNAIKYTVEGEGIIHVSAESRDSRLIVKVQDNGVGVSEADQSHLGELFFRGDQELVTQTKGYGMGIPIALACMELVGGKLFWESKSGEGSTFGISLPVIS